MQLDAATAKPIKQESAKELDARIEKIEDQLKKPPKDLWDKLQAAGGVVSGIVVALIGFYATNVYNRRHTEAEGRRRDQEVSVAQIQTIEKLIPYLAGKDEAAKRAALVAIHALGNSELAVKLASEFRGAGGTGALTTIAAGADSSQSARDALLDLLTSLQSRVVRFKVGGNLRATGFVVGPNGWIVTAAHALFQQDGDATYSVQFRSTPDIPVRVLHQNVEQDLALLKIESDEPFEPIAIATAPPRAGDIITALMFLPDGNLHVRVGSVIDPQARDILTQSEMIRIAARLDTAPGASGAPVVNREGELIGLLQGSNRSKGHLAQPTAQLIAASEVLRFVEECFRRS